MKLKKFKSVYSNNNSIAFFKTRMHIFQGYNEGRLFKSYFVNDIIVSYYKANNYKKYHV